VTEKLNVEALDVQEDPRVARSTRALGRAMSTLLAEQCFATITVQQILDRAGVSRATFYKYFRGKDDALFSSYEGMFHSLERQLDASSLSGRPRRLAPVAELLAHLDESQGVIASLQGSDRMEQIWDLGVAFMAAIIERRLVERSADLAVRDSAEISPMQRSLAARMLSGAAFEMVKWWMHRYDRQAPEVMDVQFHRMAHRALMPFGYTW
jgi:AcrR family transcriptional regulator